MTFSTRAGGHFLVCVVCAIQGVLKPTKKQLTKKVVALALQLPFPLYPKFFK
jgi:hypothetical protein